MIDRDTVLSCAQRAGFGGMARPVLYPRLAKFAELIAEWRLAQDVALCNSVAEHFKEGGDDFKDGQMDGAYQCAELLTKVK